MTRLAGKKHPAPAKKCPRPYRCSLASPKGLLALCSRDGCSVRRKSRRAFFEKSKKQNHFNELKVRN
jgi:hypothetical protein